MLDNWMCDGYPTGNDSDDYDLEVFRSEALIWQRRIDARVASLMKPNVKTCQLGADKIYAVDICNP